MVFNQDITHTTVVKLFRQAVTLYIGKTIYRYSIAIQSRYEKSGFFYVKKLNNRPTVTSIFYICQLIKRLLHISQNHGIKTHASYLFF